MEKLTAEYVRSRLRYDPLTGEFFWRKRFHKSYIGSKAGYINNSGYVAIKIDGRLYSGQRLAWLYTFGEWPKLTIDHRDRNRSYNAIENLREATTSQQSANSGVTAHNTSGVKGVTWNRSCRKWQVSVGCTYRGVFDDLEEAADVYAKAATELYGEFANVARL